MTLASHIRTKTAQTWAGLWILAIGCGSDPTSAADTETTATSNVTEPGATSVDSAADSTSTGGDDDALARCRELPAAQTAAWTEGETVVSSASSTRDRITASGERTWHLALELLRVTDAGAHPSLAMSPAVMAISLGMTHLRHEGKMCGDLIHATLGWTEDGDALHQTLGASLVALESRSLPGDEAEGVDPVVVGLTPSTWQIGEGGDATPTAAQEIFGGRRHAVSNAGDGAQAAIREVMNCVIEVESNGLLEEFLPEGVPGSDTTAYDVIVGFLQAPWATALSDVGAQPFTLDDGSTTSLPTMRGQLSGAGYYADDSMVAVDLPLRGGDLGVRIVMPAVDAFADLEAFTAALTVEQLDAIVSGAEYGEVGVTMPQFVIDSTTIDYKPLLGIDCELFTLRDVLHGAAVAMDDKGIEAAAASANEEWQTGSGPEEPLAWVDIDRPFLFFVYDGRTDYVLYSGRFAGV